ncbi:MAG: 50S ribosomal protein L24 [Verrucomicrobia bacterium GWF2_51_19]|nr:MAG: 50S ribosomal protein L24 [Verrucomicrobia bacterium GWF2_51_19]HCJ12582.1 50S ribosomal protein L24 [Opitutae bacterium]
MKSLKRGDEVVVIAGSHKGKRGKVLELLSKKNRVVVEGVAMVKKCVRKSEKNPEGGMETREGSIHYSNVMRAETFEARKARKAKS